MSCRLDRLNVAITDAADPQHQPFLVQPAVFGIEIDRNFRCALGRRLERAKAGNFRKARQICRRNLEFQLDFLGNWHGASPRGYRGRGQEINCEPALRFDHNFPPVPEIF